MTRRYTKDHEWVEFDGKLATIGISEHAQEQLGDVVFVDLPEVGREVEAEDAMAVVESVKAASDVYAPIGGRVAEVNDALVDNPALVNEAAEGDGWFVKLEPTDAAAIDDLLDADAYKALVATLS
ncbi:MAG: glycine cleavage system protein GcvH [Pseudomonadota bacterium]